MSMSERVELIPVERFEATYNSFTKELTLYAQGQVTYGVTNIFFQQEMAFPVASYSIKGTYFSGPVIQMMRPYEHHQSFKVNIWPPVENPSGLIVLHAQNGTKTTRPHVLGFPGGPGPVISSQNYGNPSDPVYGQAALPMYHPASQTMAQPMTLQPLQKVQVTADEQDSAGTGIAIYYPEKFKIEEAVPDEFTTMSISYNDTIVNLVDSGLQAPYLGTLVGPENPSKLWWQFKPIQGGSTTVIVHFSKSGGIAPPKSWKKTYDVSILRVFNSVPSNPPPHGVGAQQPQTAQIASTSEAPSAAAPAKNQAQEQKMSNHVDMTASLGVPFPISHTYDQQGGSATLERYDASGLELIGSTQKNGVATWIFKSTKLGPSYVDIQIKGGRLQYIMDVKYNIETMLGPIPPPTGDAEASKPVEHQDSDLTVIFPQEFTIKHSFPTPDGDAVLGDYDKTMIELLKHTKDNGVAMWVFKPLKLGATKTSVEIKGPFLHYWVNYNINIILGGVPTPHNGTNGTSTTA